MTNILKSVFKEYKMKKIIVLLALSVMAAHLTFSQEYTRVIELQNRRMNGPDVKAIQTRLVALGFSEIGEVDGYYGPVTEGVVKNIQLFLGFESNGKITREFWDAIFDTNYENSLKHFSIIVKYDRDRMREIKSESDFYHAPEGREKIKYYSNEKLVILDVFQYGESFQAGTSYYFFNDFVYIAERLRGFGSMGSSFEGVKYSSYHLFKNGAFKCVNGKLSKTVVDIVDDLSEELMGEITRDLSADTLFILIKAKE
jgi:hypothetical protein